MLPGGDDVLYRASLAYGSTPYHRVDVWGAGELLAENITIIDGAVTATLDSQTTRTVTLRVPETYYPMGTGELLAPEGNELRIRAGVQYADGTLYQWPVFRGRITDIELAGDGSAEVYATDRADDVVAYGFERPTPSSVGSLVTSEIQRLILDALPDASFGTSDEFATRVPPMVWEEDRGAALDEMATALGAYWYALADGTFVVRRYPWTVAGAPIVELTDGPGGIITSARARRSRGGVYNSVTVTGERADGSPPVYATARDEEPGSPTRIDGKFGRRSMHQSLNTPANQGTARTAAQDLLRRSTALTEAWALAIRPDMSLELGDVVRVRAHGRSVVQVIASMSVPLAAGNAMNLGMRAQVVAR